MSWLLEKVYADHEARVGETDKALCVYQRAVDELKYSVDFWLHYCTHVINTSDDIAFIRELFERVLEYVGYLEYESTLPKDFSRLAMIYTRNIGESYS